MNERYLYHYRADVVAVYDGDTLTADIDLGFGLWRRGVKVRLLGVDAPEMRRPTLTAARVARDYLRRRVLGQRVIIRSHRRGYYRRWLAEVWYRSDDGRWRNVADEMLAAGLVVRMGERR